MHLQPEALGDVKIRIDLQPGRIAALFEVESEPARQLLNQNLMLLRSALEARGMDVERLDVRIAQSAEPADPQDADESDEHAGGAGDHDPRREARTAPGTTVRAEQSPERDETGQSPEALPNIHAALRTWVQPAGTGGDPVMRIRLDAIA
jgi:flagellar hook-length control protein FliK